MAFKTLDDMDVHGKRVFVRADLNVPIKDGKVTDLTRITRTARTICDLLEGGAAVILASHLGRPQGVDPRLSLEPVVAPLSEVLGRDVGFAPDCIGPEVETMAAALRPGDVLLLENLRFHDEEEANDPAFADALCRLADVYVNDAFSSAHRAHASTEAMAHRLPCAAGRLMQAELDALAVVLDRPNRPVAAVVGGSKVSTKLNLLEHLVPKVDVLIIGGAMANTFLAAQGYGVGSSLCEHHMLDTARTVLKVADEQGCDVVLPVDVVVAPAFAEGAPATLVGVDAVPADQMILDIGPVSVRTVINRLAESRTLLWNGPFGAFEVKPFDAGTNAVARGAADLTEKGVLVSVAGGGDTVAALTVAGVVDDLTYVSTAGGAFLEWLEGKVLPGVAALG
ncbi:MAG: phosphoglycerate kinase [Rhodospirillaceae bacterium]|nr:phosphoglycerate kinase [Rhodospirillaceae bacterium]